MPRVTPIREGVASDLGEAAPTAAPLRVEAKLESGLDQPRQDGV